MYVTPRFTGFEAIFKPTLKAKSIVVAKYKYYVVGTVSCHIILFRYSEICGVGVVKL